MLSLILFHRFLIVCAILFCAGFALWEINAYTNDQATSRILIAVVFLVFAGALGWYLKHLRRMLNLPEDKRPPGR